MDGATEDLGADLAGVYARGSDHTWTLTLHGVTYQQDYVVFDSGDGSYDEQYITQAQATAFVLEFVGPDGTTLNSVVSGQLTRGGLPNGAVVQLANGYLYDYTFGELYPYKFFSLSVAPVDLKDGVSFSAFAYPNVSDPTFGYPEFGPARYDSANANISDTRDANAGRIEAYGQIVDIGSDVPPTPNPRLRISNGSNLEGNKGTSQLNLIVSLSGPSSQTVTAQYLTTAGSASARHDFTSASGTVTIPPGQTSRTVSIAIKGDRKPESNEYFTVELYNVTGAPLWDRFGIATILNDD